MKLGKSLCLAGLVFCGHLTAQEEGAAAASSAAAQANNPLANTKSLNLQDQFYGDLSGVNENANTLYLRAAVPFEAFGSTVISRATLPINTFPTGPGGDHETAIGDFNFFAAYLIDMGNPGISFGIGPQITAPTATDDALGSEKWSAGFANVMFNATSAKIQWGYLLTWQKSFAGDDDRADVNLGALQPFVFYQLGGGTYLRSSAVMTYDFENDAYTVPVSLGVGQVTRLSNGVLNMFFEPQVSLATDGDGQPDWGFFGGINFQF